MLYNREILFDRFTMLDLIREQLPSGLDYWKPADGSDSFLQKVSYERHIKPTFTKTQTIQDLVQQGSTSSVIEPRKRKPKPNIWDPILREIDSMYDIYPMNMKRDAKTMLIDYMKKYISSDPGSSFLGPKKCRDIMQCVTANKEYNESFWWFISFLLDAKLHIQSDDGIRDMEWYKGATVKELHIETV